MEILKTYKKDNRILKIYQDIEPENPRDWHPPSTMVCFNSRYDLGDSHDFENPEAFEKYMIENPNILALPLYLYDHSGLSMNTTGFHCQWDSGQIGWIYCNEIELKDEFDNDTEKAKEFLIANIETYDQYLRGDIYGYELVETETCNLGHVHENDIDSCWGFYGSDLKTNGMLENMDIDNLDNWECNE